MHLHREAPQKLMLMNVEMLRGATGLLLLDRNPYVLIVSAHSQSGIRRLISFCQFNISKIAVVLHPSLGFNYLLLPWQLPSSLHQCRHVPFCCT